MAILQIRDEIELIGEAGVRSASRTFSPPRRAAGQQILLSLCGWLPVWFCCALFNIVHHEDEHYLDMIRNHASGCLPEMRKDAHMKPTDSQIRKAWSLSCSDDDNWGVSCKNNSSSVQPSWLNALVALVEILKLYEAPWIEFASKRITQPDSTGSSLFLPNCSIDAYKFAGTELCAVFQLNAAPNGFVTVERQYTPHSQL
uniref:Uncharacterized protein n=1 Tax=Triticum aestivum TaxID=4565 RepID=A0A077S2L6_WHEAT|nr:unnamed protein product [Triticum aestivum]